MDQPVNDGATGSAAGAVVVVVGAVVVVTGTWLKVISIYATTIDGG